MALVPYNDKNKGKARGGPRDYPEPPSDWVRSEKPRKSDGSKGRVDVFYRDPETNALFRSKKSVWLNIRSSILAFDFDEVPEEVSFTLDNSRNEWKVHEGERRVSDEEVRLWKKTTYFVSHWNNFNGSTSNGVGDKRKQPESESPAINIHMDFKPLN